MFEVGFLNEIMIVFNHVLPKPLAEFSHGQDSVWESSFQIEFQEKVLLNASSGKGKTTFVSLLYGLRNDYSGTIEIHNQDLKTYSISDWVRLRQTDFAIVFQDLQLFGKQTVQENLAMKFDLGTSISFSEVEKWLKILGIGDKINKPCDQLSFGQQQRVAIIRSLIQDFRFLILDEPFSHLDEQNAAIALELIESRCEDLKAGYLMTTLGGDFGIKNKRMLYL